MAELQELWREFSPSHTKGHQRSILRLCHSVPNMRMYSSFNPHVVSRELSAKQIRFPLGIARLWVFRRCDVLCAENLAAFQVRRFSDGQEEYPQNL